jgi:hypothetical protein
MPASLNWARAVGPAMLALLLFIMHGWLRAHVSEFFASGLWGLLLITSYVGYGTTFLKWAVPTRMFGWGVEAALGMAISMWVGAWAAVFHLVSLRFLTMWTFLGIGALALTRARQRTTFAAQKGSTPGLRPPIYVVVLLAIFVVMIGLQYMGAIANTRFNVFDDDMGYRGFARKLLETGSMYEPFSIRRIGSYGGQTFLLASVLAGAPDPRLHLVDNGICVVILFGLIVGYRATARQAPYASIILALLVLATLPHSPHNTGSELSGVVFFLALFRLADDPQMSLTRPFANALSIGLLAGAVCTLRQSYLPAAAGTVAFAYLFRFLRDAKAQRRRWLVEAAMIAGVTLLALVPWMVMSYVNAQTIFYPLMKGTTNPGFGMVGKVPFDEEMRWFLINMGYTGPVRTIFLFLLAGFTISAARRNLAMHAQLLGCVFGYFLLLHFFQSWSDFESVARYHFAFTIAYVLAISLKAPEAVSGPARSMRKDLIAAVLVTVATALQLHDVRDTTQRLYAAWLEVTNDAFARRNPDKDRVKDPLEIFYTRLQDTVPAGERMLVMVDQTHLLDYARNDILNFDEPGALSPPPGTPFHQGPEALAAYFLSINVRYIAFVIGESSPEYRYSMWRDRAAQPVPPKNRGGLYRSMAQWYLDVFDNLISLTKSRKVLFHEFDIWVLDLSTLTGAPS